MRRNIQGLGVYHGSNSIAHSLEIIVRRRELLQLLKNPVLPQPYAAPMAAHSFVDPFIPQTSDDGHQRVEVTPNIRLLQGGVRNLQINTRHHNNSREQHE
jgi:hypothetical protein